MNQGKRGMGGRLKKSLTGRGRSGEHQERRTARRPSAELSGYDQQMGGQGERSERDSWRDGGDKAEIEEWGRDAEQKCGDWPAFKKENES